MSKCFQLTAFFLLCCLMTNNSAIAENPMLTSGNGSVPSENRGLVLSACYSLLLQSDSCKSENDWSVVKEESTLKINYRISDKGYPQFAALHLNDGYFRMVYGVEGGWGTSVIIPPGFWMGGAYYQGAPIEVTWEKECDKLILNLSGTLAGLSFSGKITLSPPGEESIVADVTMTTSGNINLDVREGEAFKPVMLSSMRISDTIWDASGAFAGAVNYTIPTTGVIVDPLVSDTTFGLSGGTSSWKTNAPTVVVDLDRMLPITGWVTPSMDSNDDNIGFWAASSAVLSSWSYTVMVKK